jgi:hypothetical protein
MPDLPVSSEDHHLVAVNRAGDMGADGLFGHEIDFHVDGLPNLIFDLDNLDQAFWFFKPDKNVNIAPIPGFSPCIGSKYGDPLSTIPGKDCDNRLTDRLLQCASCHFVPCLPVVSNQYYLSPAIIFLPVGTVS